MTLLEKGLKGALSVRSFLASPIPLHQEGFCEGSVEEDNDDKADDMGGKDEHDQEDQPALVVQDVPQESGEDNHLLS